MVVDQIPKVFLALEIYRFLSSLLGIDIYPPLSIIRVNVNMYHLPNDDDLKY